MAWDAYKFLKVQFQPQFTPPPTRQLQGQFGVTSVNPLQYHLGYCQVWVCHTVYGLGRAPTMEFMVSQQQVWRSDSRKLWCVFHFFVQQRLMKTIWVMTFEYISFLMKVLWVTVRWVGVSTILCYIFRAAQYYFFEETRVLFCLHFEEIWRWRKFHSIFFRGPKIMHCRVYECLGEEAQRKVVNWIPRVLLKSLRTWFGKRDREVSWMRTKSGYQVGEKFEELQFQFVIK